MTQGNRMIGYQTDITIWRKSRRNPARLHTTAQADATDRRLKCIFLTRVVMSSIRASNYRAKIKTERLERSL